MIGFYPPAPVLDDASRQVLKDRIQIRLMQLGMNQFVAAEKAGKNSHFIYDFMIDRKRAFKGDGLYRLAIVLECSVDYLIGKSEALGKPTPPSPHPVAS